jgi:hypothetical protein
MGLHAAFCCLCLRVKAGAATGPSPAPGTGRASARSRASRASKHSRGTHRSGGAGGGGAGASSSATAPAVVVPPCVEHQHLLPGVVAFRRMTLADHVSMAACGELFTLLLTTDREVFACGKGDGGCMGNGVLDHVFTPTMVRLGSGGRGLCLLAAAPSTDGVAVFYACESTAPCLSLRGGSSLLGPVSGASCPAPPTLPSPLLRRWWG